MATTAALTSVSHVEVATDLKRMEAKELGPSFVIVTMLMALRFVSSAAWCQSLHRSEASFSVVQTMPRSFPHIWHGGIFFDAWPLTGEAHRARVAQALYDSLTCAYVFVPWIESVVSKNAQGHDDIASNTVADV